MEDTLLRCKSCGAANRIKRDRLKSNPRCGKCGKEIIFPRAPVNISSSSYNTEVIKEPGSVLLEFWSPG